MITEIASFKILSPKTNAYNVLSTFISLKNDNTDTNFNLLIIKNIIILPGSVQAVIAENAKHSILLNSVLNML